MIQRITLESALPHVFTGMEQESPLSDSEVWLREVNLVRGRHYMVEAESGTGKSSLCSFIYGARGDYHGRILFDGADVKGFGIDRWCELRRTSLAYLPQEMMLFPELTVIENIEIKNRLTGFRDRKWIERALDELEIAHKIDQPAALLSIGQQQRVAIVRALCQPFDFLLLDEPVSHLDSRNNAKGAALIGREAEAQGASVIATSVGNKLALTYHHTLRL